MDLPLGTAHLAPDEIDLERGGAPAAAPEPRAGERGARILLVEDHDQLRAWLAESLGENFRVVAARDGVEALALATRSTFDLVISDVKMPGMDGLALVRQLRRLPGGAGLPLMLISARQEVDDRVEGLELADDYLAKPFQMPELLARARALLRRNAPPAPLSEDSATFFAELRSCAEARLADRDFSAGALAKAMAMSPRTLQLRMVEPDLPTPNEWLRNLRIEQAEALLRSGAAGSVGDAAAAVGMERAYFSRVYAARTGRPPSEDLR